LRVGQHDISEMLSLNNDQCGLLNSLPVYWLLSFIYCRKFRETYQQKIGRQAAFSRSFLSSLGRPTDELQITCEEAGVANFKVTYHEEICIIGIRDEIRSRGFSNTSQECQVPRCSVRVKQIHSISCCARARWMTFSRRNAKTENAAPAVC
jgi:hypothetical protein